MTSSAESKSNTYPTKARWIIGLIILLIIVRALMPTLHFDEISFALFILILLIVLWPEIGTFAKYIRKFRFGDLEFELVEQKVEELEEKADQAEMAQDLKTGGQAPQRITPEVEKRIESAGEDPRSAFLLIAIDIEQKITQLAKRHEISQTRPLSKVLTQLSENQIITREVVSLFNDFWTVRNYVTHKAGLNISKGQLYQLIDIGIRILNLLSEYQDEREAL